MHNQYHHLLLLRFSKLECKKNIQHHSLRICTFSLQVKTWLYDGILQRDRQDKYAFLLCRSRSSLYIRSFRNMDFSHCKGTLQLAFNHLLKHKFLSLKSAGFCYFIMMHLLTKPLPTHLWWHQISAIHTIFISQLISCGLD